MCAPSARRTQAPAHTHPPRGRAVSPSPGLHVPECKFVSEDPLSLDGIPAPWIGTPGELWDSAHPLRLTSLAESRLSSSGRCGLLQQEMHAREKSEPVRISCWLGSSPRAYGTAFNVIAYATTE